MPACAPAPVSESCRVVRREDVVCGRVSSMHASIWLCEQNGCEDERRWWGRRRRRRRRKWWCWKWKRKRSRSDGQARRSGERSHPDDDPSYVLQVLKFHSCATCLLLLGIMPPDLAPHVVQEDDHEQDLERARAGGMMEKGEGRREKEKSSREHRRQSEMPQTLRF